MGNGARLPLRLENCLAQFRSSPELWLESQPSPLIYHKVITTCGFEAHIFDIDNETGLITLMSLTTVDVLMP